MNKIHFALASTAFLIATTGFSSTTFDYDQKTLELVNVLSKCQTEYEEAMEGANRIGSASFSEPRPADSDFRVSTFTIVTVKGGGGFEPQPEEVAKLKIKRTTDSRSQIPDRPAKVTYECEVTRD